MNSIRKDNVGVMNLQDNDESDMICESQNQKGSVLVADGDNHISNKFSAVTDRMGYDVAVSNNGEEALDLLLKRSFDIVFTALKMPGTFGNCEVCGEEISINRLKARPVTTNCIACKNKMEAMEKAAGV